MSASFPEPVGAPRLAAAAAALALLPACRGGEPPSTILLVSLDTVRADALTFEDHLVSPRLAELAERGTVLAQAISGSSWTLPAHAQLFTGQPPALHGVQDDNIRIDPLTRTLPEVLQTAGFATFGVFTGWYLLSDFGFGRGFDVYANAMPGGDQLESELRTALTTGDSELAMLAWGAADTQSHRAITSPDVVTFAREALSANRGKDLFLFTHLFDPHYDYVPPAPYDTRFDPEYEGPIDGRDFYRNTAVFDPAAGGRVISDRDLEHVIALYMGEIAWTDEHVGQIVDLLASENRLDHAWIVLVSDHGEEFFEHGGRGHRHTLYEEQLRVPLLLVPPGDLGLPAPLRSTVQVSLSDVLPTLTEALGLDTPASVAGRSLLPVLRGEDLESRPLVSSLRARPMVVRVDGDEEPNVKHFLTESVRWPDRKLIRHVKVTHGERELVWARFFDLVADPYEERPVTDPADPRLAAAWDDLENEHARLRTLHADAETSPDSDRATRARDLMMGQLEALGYKEPGQELVDDRLPWGLAPPPALTLPY